VSNTRVVAAISSTTVSPLAQFVGMAATGKAPWAIYVATLLAQGLPTATPLTVQVQDHINRDIHQGNASRTSSVTPAALATPTFVLDQTRTDAMSAWGGSVYSRFVPDGYVWGPYGSSEFVKWAPDGTRQTLFPFSTPDGVAASGQNGIWAADLNGHIYYGYGVHYVYNYVQKYTLSGTKVAEVGGSAPRSMTDPHTNLGQFAGSPSALAIGSNGHVLVGDRLGRVQEFDGDLNFLRYIVVPGGGNNIQVTALGIDGSGLIHVAVFNTGMIHVYSHNDLELQYSWSMCPQCPSWSTGGWPRAIAFDGDENCYVASQTLLSVAVYPRGNDGRYGTMSTQLQDGFSNPWGLSIHTDGQLFVVDDHNYVTQTIKFYTGAAPTTTTPVSAVGDPHLRNMYGERFDLFKQGKSVLISIPRGKVGKDLLLAVEADARSLGGQCADTYFQALNITGAWADTVKPGGLHYVASSASQEESKWAKFGPVELKVVIGRTAQGIRYLNFYVKNLGRVGFDVGGLLGFDDHLEAATPSQACVKRVVLRIVTDGPKGQRGSVAEAAP